MTEDEIYEYLGQVFEWSRVKAAKNVLRHGVRFPEAATVFFDPHNLTVSDDEHSIDEQRYTVIGRSIRDRALIVVHVQRGERIRIISARKPTLQERRDYETGLGR